MTFVSILLAIFIGFSLDNGVSPNLPWLAVIVGMVADSLISISNSIKEYTKVYKEVHLDVRRKEDL